MNDSTPAVTAVEDVVSTVSTAAEPPMPGWAIVVTGIGLCILAVVLWLWLVSCANRSQSRENRQLQDHPYPWYCCVPPVKHVAPKTVAQRKRRLRLKQAQRELRAMESSDGTRPPSTASIPQRNRMSSTRSSTSSTGKKISFIDQPTTIRDRHTSEPASKKAQRLYSANNLRDRHCSDPTKKSLMHDSHVHFQNSDKDVECQKSKDSATEELLIRKEDGTNGRIDMPPSYSEVMNPEHPAKMPKRSTPRPSPNASTSSSPSTSSQNVNEDCVVFDIVSE